MNKKGTKRIIELLETILEEVRERDTVIRIDSPGYSDFSTATRLETEWSTGGTQILDDIKH